MTEEEIKSFINKCLDKRLDDFKSGYMKRLNNFEEHVRKKLDNEYGNVLNTYKSMKEEKLSMELKFNSLQIGLNNVYAEFQKLTTEDFLRDFNAKHNEFKSEFRRMKKDIEECQDFVEKGYKKISGINALYSLRNTDLKMVEKISSIINLIEEKYEF